MQGVGGGGRTGVGARAGEGAPPGFWAPPLHAWRPNRFRRPEATRAPSWQGLVNRCGAVARGPIPAQTLVSLARRMFYEYLKMR